MGYSKLLTNAFIGLFIITLLLACTIIFWANDSVKSTPSFRAALKHIHENVETQQYTGGIEDIGFLSLLKLLQE